jgi:dihydropteroate synthase-like protein
MPQHILFLTGRLAEKSLHQVLQAMQPTPFTYTVHQLGLNVAGLMTADMIRRRLPELQDADRVIVPGRCRGDLEALSADYGIPFERGPEELKDLPQFFGRASTKTDLSQHDVRIFAEIVDAPRMQVDSVIDTARQLRDWGADVIDLGCLPETPFHHLEQCVHALRAEGHRVSVDSIDPDELLRGGRAGADFLLSLKEDTLWIAQEVASIPVVIPAQPGDMASLHRAMQILQNQSKPFIADPILDPIHFGFADSLVRYHALRQTFPDVEIMMGTGNLSELTDADTGGMHALLFGIISELRIRNVLTTQVSRHAQRAISEADAARRMMHAAHRSHSLPRGFSDALLALHERNPFPYTSDEIAELAAAIKDPSFRVQVSEAGIHVYNREGLKTERDPFKFFPELNLENDGSHAFYMGVELARAQIAWQLGKRYVQDQALAWGCAAEAESQDIKNYYAPGTTLGRMREGPA